MIIEYINRQIIWSRKTFGEGPQVEKHCRHLEKEIAEIRANPTDLEEWVDVILLALDGAWRAGYTPWAIVAGLIRKQRTNAARRWILPEDENEPVRHDR